jgi:ketosteroid isomerase-like protein
VDPQRDNQRMSADDIAVAKRMYDARNRGDVEAVLAECDTDIEWHPHLATLGGKPIIGHTGVREYLSSLRQDWESFQHEPEEFFDFGDKVVAFLHTFARGKSSGIDVDVRVGHVLTFRNGKVLRFVSYLDRGEALKGAEEG